MWHDRILSARVAERRFALTWQSYPCSAILLLLPSCSLARHPLYAAHDVKIKPLSHASHGQTHTIGRGICTQWRRDSRTPCRSRKWCRCHLPRPPLRVAQNLPPHLPHCASQQTCPFGLTTPLVHHLRAGVPFCKAVWPLNGFGRGSFCVVCGAAGNTLFSCLRKLSGQCSMTQAFGARLIDLGLLLLTPKVGHEPPTCCAP